VSGPALSEALGPGPVLITGGAGFIGSNLADSLLTERREVVVLDDLSRAGVGANLDWLAARHGDLLRVLRADVRDAAALREATRGIVACVHLAAQTAVTTSLADPVQDFEINARGTLNLLEALRAEQRPVPLVFASTNKVYGSLADLAMTDASGRHEPADARLRQRGIDESQPLNFCTPYGCSKGVADQYVLDYARSYGMPAVVLRMSCVYGPRQFGTEDQGWVAHFLIRALKGEAITIYGDGRQVRDVLDVGDAVAAYRAVLAGMDRHSGRAFNLGGGPANAVSLREVVDEISRTAGRAARLSWGNWREGDQPWFVADASALSAATGWQAHTLWREGLARLAAWLREARTDLLPDPTSDLPSARERAPA
jgi:CDP-paratose 2-epimerase